MDSTSCVLGTLHAGRAIHKLVIKISCLVFSKCVFFFLSDEFERRVNFMPEEFAHKYSLGTAVAGNFYLTENFEDLVETIDFLS